MLDVKGLRSKFISVNTFKPIMFWLWFQYDCSEFWLSLTYPLSLWYFKASSSTLWSYEISLSCVYMWFFVCLFVCLFVCFVPLEYFQSEVSNLYFWKVPVTISSSISFPLFIFPSGISTVCIWHFYSPYHWSFNWWFFSIIKASLMSFSESFLIFLLLNSFLL